MHRNEFERDKSIEMGNTAPNIKVGILDIKLDLKTQFTLLICVAQLKLSLELS